MKQDDVNMVETINLKKDTFNSIHGISQSDLYDLGNQICHKYWNVKLDCTVYWSDMPRTDNACGQFITEHLKNSQYRFFILLCPYLLKDYGYDFLVANLKHELCHWLCWKLNLDCGISNHTGAFPMVLATIHGIARGIPPKNQLCSIYRCNKCGRMTYSNDCAKNVYCSRCHRSLSDDDLITMIPFKKLIQINYDESVNDYAKKFYQKWIY